MILWFYEILHQCLSCGFKPRAVSSGPPCPRMSEVAKQQIRHPRTKSRKGRLRGNPETVLRTENYWNANGWRLGESLWEFYICYTVLKLFPCFGLLLEMGSLGRWILNWPCATALFLWHVPLMIHIVMKRLLLWICWVANLLNFCSWLSLCSFHKQYFHPF